MSQLGLLLQFVGAHNSARRFLGLWQKDVAQNRCYGQGQEPVPRASRRCYEGTT